MSAQTSASAKPRNKQANRAGLASFVGTTVEWYDFYIYGTASALVFGDVFFSSDLDHSTKTVLAFITLWAGFIARPLGGIIFGHLGDKHGRKISLVATLMMMGVASVAIGLLPGYSVIGIWAPILLTVLRIVQGIAVGGEWGGAVLVASENAPKGKSILYSAFAQQGSPAGNLLATFVFYLLSFIPTPEFVMWGWRIAFVASFALVVIGMVIRLKLSESEDMKKVQQTGQKVRVPLGEVLKDHWKLVLLAAGALPIVHVTYLKTTFALAWATNGEHSWAFDRSQFLSIIVIALVVQFCAQPIGALILSNVRDMRVALLWVIVPEFITLPAMFFMIESGSFALAAFGMALATVPHAMFYAVIGGILARAFPARIRYTGLSVGYQLCSMVVAGGTPTIAQLLLNRFDSIVPVAVLGALYALSSLVCTIAILNRTGWTAAEYSHAEQADYDAFNSAEGVAGDEALDTRGGGNASAETTDGRTAEVAADNLGKSVSPSDGGRERKSDFPL